MKEDSQKKKFEFGDLFKKKVEITYFTMLVIFIGGVALGAWLW